MLSLTTKNSHNTTVTMPGMLKSSSSSTLRQPPRPLLWLCSAALHRLKLLQPSAVMHHVDSTLCLRMPASFFLSMWCCISARNRDFSKHNTTHVNLALCCKIANVLQRTHGSRKTFKTHSTSTAAGRLLHSSAGLLEQTQALP